MTAIFIPDDVLRKRLPDSAPLTYHGVTLYWCAQCERYGIPSIYGPSCTACANAGRMPGDIRLEMKKHVESQGRTWR